LRITLTSTGKLGSVGVSATAFDPFRVKKKSEITLTVYPKLYITVTLLRFVENWKKIALKMLTHYLNVFKIQRYAPRAAATSGATISFL
jgi:hypothetical protein